MGGKVFLRRLFLILILLVNVALAGDGGGGDLFSKMRINSIKSDEKAPDFSLKDLSGKKVDIKDYKWKIVFLNF